MSAGNRVIRWHFVGLLAVIGLLVGCSGKYTYPNTLAKNLYIQTETDSGSVFSSVRAAVGIYGVDDQCEIEYQGTVNLDERPISVGIPLGRPSYLVFEFASSSFLANSSRSITYETLLTPVAGRDYDLKVSYLDDIYNVEIRESRPGDVVARNIDRKDLRACSGV
jgi:hypothetical protein